MSSDAAIVYAHPDRRKFPLAVPADPLFARQRSLHASRRGIRASAAWDTPTGSPGSVVAVFDTGMLAGDRVVAARLAAGYDLVHQVAPGLFITASDGRDHDPADSGNRLKATEAGHLHEQRLWRR